MTTKQPSGNDPQKEEWEERLVREFPDDPCGTGEHTLSVEAHDLKQFIRAEIAKARQEEREKAVAFLRGIAEIYIGMEGCQPSTDVEAYLFQVLREMYEETQSALQHFNPEKESQKT